MKEPFKQTASIIRQLKLLGLSLLVIFLVDILVTYGTSRFLVNGLQKVHESNQILELSTQTIDNISAAMEVLRGARPTANLADVIAVYQVNEKQAKDSLIRAMNQKSPTPEVDMLLKSSLEAFIQLSSSAQDLFNNLKHRDSRTAVEQAKGDLLLASQFEIEARDPLKKVQILLQKSSSEAFYRVYGSRNDPTFSVLGLGLFFLAYAAFVGFPLIRNLTRSITALLQGTDIVAKGQLDYQVPILSHNELGKVTHAFNRMVSSLSEKEKEVRENTEKERNRLQFLVLSSEELSRSMDYQETLWNVARVPIPYLADWCIVDLLQEDGSIKRVSGAHADPNKLQYLKQLLELYPPDTSGNHSVAKVIRTGKTEVVGIVSESVLSEAARGSNHHREILDTLGATSYICVPLIAGGRTFGVFSFMLTTSARTFTDTEIAMAQELGRRAGLAINNVLLYESEKEARKQAQEAVKVRDEFLSIASHELRTPLTPLRMQLQNLKRTFSKEEALLPVPRLQKMIETSDRMVMRLIQLVEDLLDTSRLNAGQLALRLENFNLTEMVLEVIDRYRGEFEKSNCNVISHVEENIQGCWDRSRMEQVLINLLTNAMRYGLGKPIEISLKQSDHKAILKIRDHGIGIELEDQHRIFQRFERASPSSHYGGLGLGLFITSEILHLHRGKISVQSKLGQGSEFTVEVPLMPDAGT